jgi:hypothetical protein
VSPGLPELAPLLGALVALLLRRWPAKALVAGVLVGWGLAVGWPPAWAPRAAPALAMGALLLLPSRVRVWGWPAAALAALAAAVGVLWHWMGPRDALSMVVGVGGLAVAGLVPGAVLGRTAGRGAWAAVAAAGFATSALLALTGSTRLAAEAALFWMPALGLLGRPMDAGHARLAGIGMGMAAAAGVLLSDLGPWVLAPLLPLLAAGLGRRDTPWPGTKAAAAAWLAAGLVVAPVLLDWLRDPPF